MCKVNPNKSFVRGNPLAARKCLRIYRINFDYGQQKEKYEIAFKFCINNSFS